MPMTSPRFPVTTAWPLMNSMACAFALRPAIILPFLDSPDQYVLTLVTGFDVERGSRGLEEVVEGTGYAELPQLVSGHRSRSYSDTRTSRKQNKARAARDQEKGVFDKESKRRKVFFKLFMPWYVRGADGREKEMLTEAGHLPAEAHAPRPLSLIHI